MTNIKVRPREPNYSDLQFEGRLPDEVHVLSIARYGELLIFATDDGIWIIDPEDLPVTLRRLDPVPFRDGRIN